MVSWFMSCRLQEGVHLLNSPSEKCLAVIILLIIKSFFFVFFLRRSRRSRSWLAIKVMHLNRSLTVRKLNAQPLSSEVYEITAGALVAGDVLLTTFHCTQTEIGQTPNTPEIRVMNKDGVDVTAHYSFVREIGMLTVTKRVLIIETWGKEFLYDGTAHDEKGYTVGENTPLLEGHSIKVLGGIQVTNVGAYDNLLNIDILDSNNNSVLEDYYVVQMVQGQLVVTPRKITVNTPTNEWAYDGLTHTDGAAVVDPESEGLANGHEMEIKNITSITELGSTENHGEAVITSGGANVTDNYEITYVYGTITVRPRRITLTSGTESRPYDGTPLVLETLTEEGEGLLEGHRIDAT